jgi:hypothetical protein
MLPAAASFPAGIGDRRLDAAVVAIPDDPAVRTARIGFHLLYNSPGLGDRLRRRRIERRSLDDRGSQN